MKRLKLPVGVDSFEKLRREVFHYIDKPRPIRDLLNNRGEVRASAFSSRRPLIGYGFLSIRADWGADDVYEPGHHAVRMCFFPAFLRRS